MSRRRLKPDELELWRKVTETTQPISSRRAVTDAPLLNREPKRQLLKPIKGFEIGVGRNGSLPSHDVLPGLPERLAQATLKMDKRVFGKLKRGKLLPEGKIDLHGMTMDRAHPALTRFILKSHAAGKRLVLVVTGKGKNRDDGGPIPVRLGLLRHNVPVWLAAPPLSQVVLQLTVAHAKHGGGGAYYVYLKRQR